MTDMARELPEREGSAWADCSGVRCRKASLTFRGSSREEPGSHGLGVGEELPFSQYAFVSSPTSHSVCLLLI